MLPEFAARIIRPEVDANQRPIIADQRCPNFILWVLICATCLLVLCPQALAQPELKITGDRLSGFVLPIEPINADISIRALRATTWTVDDTKRVLAEGDVRITVGTRVFAAQRAVVWLNRIPSENGLINQLALYLQSTAPVGGSAGAPLSLSVQGDELLVTASARGEVRLDLGHFEEGESRSSFVHKAQERLALHLRRLAAGRAALKDVPQIHAFGAATDFVPQPGGAPAVDDSGLPQRIAIPGAHVNEPWLARPEGIIRFSTAHAELSRGEHENVLTIVGPLTIEYIADRNQRDLSQLTLVAERAVIFADPGPLESIGGEMDASAVRGIYLEGNVNVTAERGQYSVRAPYVYYDFRRQQAIMLNSVLRAQARRNAPPAYARAEEMRQMAESQWTAQRVVVSTSEFFTPHLAIGAESMLITQRRVPLDRESDGELEFEVRTFVESRGNTLQASGVSIFPWPRFSGDVEDVPLRSIEFGTRDNDGLRVFTDWDLYSIMGWRKPEGVDATLSVDGFTKRGAGGGVDFAYEKNQNAGAISLYGLFDEGLDRTSSGRNVEPDDKFRGWALLEHQTKLSEYWTLQAQGALISDDTLFTAWQDEWFRNEREFETSAYLKHQRENAALTLLAKYQLQDFLSNDYLLASRQYSVDKLPELGYRRYGDSLFDFLTYSMENRATRMALAFQRTTPGDIGVREGAFGIDQHVLISDALRLRGLREKWVNRLDSRHELALPINLGHIKVVPFVVGRFTGYDDDFEEFSSDTDTLRYFGAAGVRASTQFQRVHNDAENRILNIHRLRHILEPYVTVWHAQANMDQFDFPVYDEEVESIADGNAIQIGLRNTWQTQRGGPGMWRSVDVFMLDASVAFDSEGEPPPTESPTPQFFEYWPEYSRFGDHVRAAMSWLISDSLSLVGETTYALEPDEFARGSIGLELRHSPLLVTYVEYRTIEASQTELLGVGWTYQLTPKYRIALSPQYDFQEEDFRALNARITRSFPDFDFTLQVRYDQIRDDTSVGASLSLGEF